ncbi:hypothetical protein Y710_06980 [Gordonia sp. QH-12]|uniref:hypothetical protein n=1 Tax=Gordonia sp. QH-12 TaxID=1437876 RepID=UPI000782A167|nr:hypothetical protein [Gordonia sp. QH-12]KXT57521.1 hypothetical protein Y710_06980 [Gordonia sp. QH-12]
MTTTASALRKLAILSGLDKQVKAALADAKAEAAKELPRGTIHVFVDADDPMSESLGYLSVPKPSQPSPQIVDETLAMSWLLETFGEDGMVEMRLSSQGRTTLIEAAKRGHVPGVEVPEPKPSSPRWRPSDNVVELVQAMWRRGDFSLDDLVQREVEA